MPTVPNFEISETTGRPQTATPKSGGNYPVVLEFNPRAFGALGDGVKDDTLGLAAAAAAAVAAGGCLVIPDGTFLLSTTLALPPTVIGYGGTLKWNGASGGTIASVTATGPVNIIGLITNKNALATVALAVSAAGQYVSIISSILDGTVTLTTLTHLSSVGNVYKGAVTLTADSEVVDSNGDTFTTGSWVLTGASTAVNSAASLGPNGQRLEVKMLTELVTVAAAATTDTVIQMPAGAIVLAVPVRVTVALPVTTNFTVGDSGSAARFSTAAVSKAINSTDKGTKAGAYYNATALEVRLTPNSTPSDATGRVRVTIYYILVTPPTS